MAFEGDDNTENVRPKSSALPSKKERKIKDDDFAIGGMRHPKKAVDQTASGERMRRADQK